MQFISKANNRKWPDLQINDRWEFSKIFAGFSFYKTPFLWKRIHWPDLFLGIINEWESPVLKSRSSRVVDFLFFCPIFLSWVILTIGCISWARQQFCSEKKIICQLGLSDWVQMNNMRNRNTACNTCGFSGDKKNENYAIWPNSSHSAVPSFPIKLSSWLKLFGGWIECMETFRQTFNIHIISTEIHSDWFV